MNVYILWSFRCFFLEALWVMGEGGDPEFLGRRLRRPVLAYITQLVKVIQVAVQSN